MRIAQNNTFSTDHNGPIPRTWYVVYFCSFITGVHKLSHLDVMIT